MHGASPQTTFQQYKPQFQGYSNSSINQHWVNEKFNRIIADQQRNFIASNLNPFNLCPSSVTFWLPLIPYVNIGITVSSLKKIGIVIRQQIEPNETISVIIRIFELQIPFPLTLLTLFSLLGLWTNGAVNKIIDEATTQLMNEQEALLENLEEKISSIFMDIAQDLSQLPPDTLKKSREALDEENDTRIRQALNLFNLNPTMTVSFPIYKTHTAIYIGFTDLQRLSISIKQFLEPQHVIFTLIHIIELKVPFPLTILALFLSNGLFLNGSINGFEQGTRSGIMNEVKRIFQQYRK